MASWMVAPEQRNPQQAEQASLSELLIEELQGSDTLVIGMPLYNFGVPSTFKAWIDRIARAGITFRYTENGPEGLLNGKKVYIVATRGGMYKGTAKDSQTQYLTDVLGFLGMHEVNFIYAEGLHMPGGDVRLQLATDEINSIGESDL
jgi:FMN-dependent NADH-azoreductase